MNNSLRLTQGFLLTLAVLLLTSCGVHRASSRPERYVVVLSCDGFRASYQKTYSTPNIDRIAKNGLQCEFIPCFPSLTFPNHYSMATGLYPDHHGLIHNRFVDRERGRYYALGDRKSVEDPSFYKGDPIWNTAERQGVRTASFFWVGSETAIGGHQPSRWKRFDASVSFQARADSVLHWLELPPSERPRLIMWYLDEPDHTGHSYGPHSAETKAKVAQVDSLIGYFYDKLCKLPIGSQVDFIIVADHGMADYYPEKYVNLQEYLSPDEFEYITEGVPTLLYLKDKTQTQHVLDVLSKVPHIRSYARENLPARYHYGSSPLIGDIVVIPDPGTMVQFRAKGSPKRGGAHGYDNRDPSMRALFVASGPSFRPGTRHTAVPNITLYPLICKILGLIPSANDGDPRLADKLLR